MSAKDQTMLNSSTSIKKYVRVIFESLLRVIWKESTTSHQFSTVVTSEREREKMGGSTLTHNNLVTIIVEEKKGCQFHDVRAWWLVDVCRPFYTQHQHRQNIKEIPIIDVPALLFSHSWFLCWFTRMKLKKVERQMEDYGKY